jgi:arylformamidase
VGELVELSHPLADGMDAYPGLPSPRIGAVVDHAASRPRYDGEEFYLGRIETPGNVGTYLDAPFHRFPDRADLSQVPIDRLVGLRAWVVEAAGAGDRELTPRLPDADLSGGAVLVRTGWDARWGTAAYWEPGPYLSEAFAALLVERGVGLAGVDFWNVDDTSTRRRPIHTSLLGAGILLVEHLCNLDRLPRDGFRFSAPVLRIERGASFPVRAYAELDRPT